MKGIDSARVEAAIRAAEARTSGELRVAVARFFLGHDVRRAAEKTFARLGIHRTKRGNGVLIFIAPLGRRCAVVADEGAHGAVDPAFWGSLVDRLLDRFRAGDLTGGLESGIQEIADRLSGPFPCEPGDVNELPDTVAT
ncbi:MAG TPA: TPM domain-containing protein [Polyangia bacterium]|nr:TPM domain-containing protein [Polyangia bacterium]